MKFIPKLASALFGTCLLFGTGVKASTYEDHQVLWETLEYHGIEIVINDTHACENGIAGLYSPQYNTVIVCQDNRNPLTRTEVEWTDNDYDTLRHEAHHALQDCLTGLDNGDSTTLFQNGDLQYFVESQLKDYQIENIISSYRNMGANNNTVRQELEAFAIASINDPIQLARGLNQICNS